MKFKLARWFAHPTYLLFWLAFGILVWSPWSTETSSYQLSSEAAQLEEDQNQDAQNSEKAQTFEEALQQLQKDYQDFTPAENFAMAPAQIEEIERQLEGDPELLQIKSQYSFANIGEEDLNYLVSYEDTKTCGKERNYLEKAFENPKAADWIQERAKESKNISRKCVAFALNSFPEITTQKVAKSFKSRPSTVFGRCPKGSSGSPALDGKGNRVKNPVPCVSKNLVNATYNAFSDVTACLNLDPKELLPKIYNESGFYVNALGAGKDGGIGQLTKPAIDQVNSVFPKYIEQIEKAAAANPNGPCARIIKNKALIAPVKSDVTDRCGLMWPPENPLRNLLYSAILTRDNIRAVSGITFKAGTDVIAEDGKEIPVTGTAADEFGGKFKKAEIKQKFEQLGLKNMNLHSVKMMLALAGYNSGISTAINTLENYLDQRIEANKKTKSKKYNLKLEDFDFEVTKDAVKEARSLIMSSFISPTADKKSKELKVKLRKQLPTAWADAYQKPFPVYMALKMNAYTGGKAGNYQIYGFPGYLTALYAKNKMIRETFRSGGVDPNFCTNDNFLKFK